MRNRSNPFSRQSGFSLIELMISIVLGLVIVGALSILFANNSRARVEMDKTSQQIENGRYASQALLEDVRLAGYYGEFSPTVLTLPATLPDPSGTDAATLVNGMRLAVQGYHMGVTTASYSTIPSGVTALLTDIRPHSDVLVVRRVSTCSSGPTSALKDASCDAMDGTKYWYFQTALCQSQLTNLASTSQYLFSQTTTDFTTSNVNVTTAPTYLTQKDCTTPAVTRAVVARIYYVANNDVAGDGIPTLKMVELGAGTWSTPLAIAEGIEAIQVEYGIDWNGDGTPEFYTPDPGTVAYNNGTAQAWPVATYPYPGTGDVGAWSLVTAVKLHVLARNTLSTPGFSDTRTYVLGSDAYTDNTYGPYNDSYKRHVYTTAVRLQNVAGRLE